MPPDVSAQAECKPIPPRMPTLFLRVIAWVNPGPSPFASKSAVSTSEKGRRAEPESNVRDHSRQFAKVRQLHISPAGSTVSGKVQEMLAKLPKAELTSMGSSLKFCLIAEGTADLYPRFVPTNEWDTAAAQCIVEVAGGKVCLLDGTQLDYQKEVIRNPSFIVVGDQTIPWKEYVE